MGEEHSRCATITEAINIHIISHLSLANVFHRSHIRMQCMRVNFKGRCSFRSVFNHRKNKKQPNPQIIFEVEQLFYLSRTIVYFCFVHRHRHRHRRRRFFLYTLVFFSVCFLVNTTHILVFWKRQ